MSEALGVSASGFYEWLKQGSQPLLLASVSRLKLVANGKDQNDIFGRQPAVFRDISVATAREDEFPPAILCGLSKQRMVAKKLKSLTHAQNLFACLLGVLGANEVKEPFEIGKCPLGYFDRRHARALGRRALTPDARAAR